MQERRSFRKEIIYGVLALVSILSLGIAKSIARPIAILGAPSAKNFTFDKTSVPTGVHGLEGETVTLQSTAEGRSDIVYTPLASYEGNLRSVYLGGNYLMSLTDDSGAGDGRFLEFYFGVNNLTSLSIEIGHTLADPDAALMFSVHLAETYDQSDPLVWYEGKTFDLIEEPSGPGVYNFDLVNYPAIDFSVQYVIVMYCSFYDIMDPLNGKQMFIKSISASWYC